MLERWLRLLFLAGVIGVFARATPLVVVVALMLGLVVLSQLHRLLALRGVRYSRRFNETRSFVGEQVRMTGVIENTGRLPIFSLTVDDTAPRHILEGAGENGKPRGNDLAQRVALPARSRASATFMLESQRRGYFFFLPPNIRAPDLLGLDESERSVPLRDSILVYPHVFDVADLPLPEQQPLGELASIRRLIEDPVRNIGARDYAPGDSFRQVHWKATAHRGSLQTRVNEHTADPMLHILLNVTTFQDDWIGVDVDRFEWTVSVAASVASWAHKSGATLGLSSNGAAPGLPESLRVKARRSPDHLTRILESLAVVQAFTGSRYEDFLLNEQRHVSHGASLLLITPLVNERILIAVNQLALRGKRMVLLSCDYGIPPDFAPCPVLHWPVPLMHNTAL